MELIQSTFSVGAGEWHWALKILALRGPGS